MLSREELLEIEEIEQLPEWASRVAKEGEIARWQQAYTRDGSKCGNAVVMEITFIRNEVHFSLVTEAGNVMNNLSKREFDELFTPGKWLMNGFPTDRAEKAWYNRNVS